MNREPVVTQTKTVVRIGEKPVRCTIIRMAREGSRERAEQFKQMIWANGCYMDFEVLICPAGGEFEILVQSRYDAPKEEILGMLLSILYSHIARY